MRVGDSWRKLASSDLAVLVLWATAGVLLHTVTGREVTYDVEEESPDVCRRKVAIRSFIEAGWSTYAEQIILPSNRPRPQLRLCKRSTI
jgi:hypothetical protein